MQVAFPQATLLYPVLIRKKEPSAGPKVLSKSKKSSTFGGEMTLNRTVECFGFGTNVSSSN